MRYLCLLRKQKAYNKQKADLGKELFRDKRLSKDKTISCETCHNLEITATGTSNQKLLNPPTLLNSSLNFIFSSKGDIKIYSEQDKKIIKHSRIKESLTVKR
ncbi:hypothetical protein CFF27374_08850 [Campylobacter fetus subsp. fetus]|nr:hypothetical protein CFF27374_08850 [Campylobacter fetus subsp. fetus]